MRICKRLSLWLGLAAAMCAGAALSATPPYEMVEAGRTHDDSPVLLPLVDASGWRVECEGAEATLERATDRVLFGDGVARLFYRVTATNSVIRLRRVNPEPIEPGCTAASLWVWGHLLPYHRLTNDLPVKIVADFVDADGVAVSLDMRDTNFSNWFMISRRFEQADAAKLAKGGQFVGFTLTGMTNRERKSFDMTSFRVFREEWKPLSPKPRPRRGFMNFPGADAGVNTGEGKLPFPNTSLTIAPPRAKNPQVEFRFPSKATNWDDFAFRYAGGEWQCFAVGGGVYMRSETGDAKALPDYDVCGVKIVNNRSSRPMKRADIEDGTWTRKGSTAVFRGNFVIDGEKLGEGEVRFSVSGQNAIVDVWVRGGNVEEVRFGRWRAPGAVKYIEVPYYTYKRGRSLDKPNILMADLGNAAVFFGAAMDWTQSASSVPYCYLDRVKDGTVAANGATTYRPRTDGRLNDCRERFVWSVSETFDEVLPNIPNPPSPYRETAGSHVWRSHEASRDRAKDYAKWDAAVRRGLRHMCVTDHETMWRDDFESFTMRTNAAPRKGGDAAQLAYTRHMIDDLGLAYGPYNTFLDISTISAFWHPDHVMREADGQLKTGWQRCYVPKAAFACEMNDLLTPVVQKKFGFNCAYCDQHTIFTPWTRIDYDHRVPGAGTFAATYYAFGELLLKQRECFGGPIFSEGGAHFMYAGLCDGSYAQEYEYSLPGSPWLVDFDLMRMHPLECDIGISGRRHLYRKVGGPPADADYAADYWLAATIAFGHVGLIERDGADEWRTYFMTQAIAAKYCAARVSSIHYLNARGERETTSEALKSGAIARSHVLVEYDDGTFVGANGSYGDGACEMKAAALGFRRDLIVTLPSGGFCARSGDGTVSVFAGIVNGRRARCAVSPEYAYVGSEAGWTTFSAGATDGELVRLKNADGTEEVLMSAKATAVELPYVVRSAVGLDEERRETGKIQFSVADGRTRFGKFPAGVVSVKVVKAK